ncbi:riboflavin synthase [Candidatus Micrarchaeota archaeon]|nr:riboflavin synthase [Candidatus Micrarchaeota archaeon]
MKIGVVDTTFSRVNMGAIALDEIKKSKNKVTTTRTTVPGIKDLAVECKLLLEKEKCDIVLALGMVGGMEIDQQCAHEASLGIQQAKLMTNKHIIEVFVHENEAWDANELNEIFENRIRKHVQNAVALITDPKSLTENAGLGIRQGKDDEGSLAQWQVQKTKIGIVVAKFNPEITQRMVNKALEVARKVGFVAEVREVPGVFDMPLVVKKLLMDKQIIGVATLGAVIKGETAHDEIVTKTTASKLAYLSLEFRKPVGLGIIGHNVSWEQAEARAETYAEHSIEAIGQLIEVLRK